MGMFDAINALSKLAENPAFGEGMAGAAEHIATAAGKLPSQIDEIVRLLGSVAEKLDTANNRLVEISLGLDTLADPVGRPKFTAGDVQAMMDSAWPPTPVDLVAMAKEPVNEQ